MNAAEADDFLSGTSGQVFGVRATSRALLRDAWCAVDAGLRLTPWRLRRAAAGGARRRILVLSVAREDAPNLISAARAELNRSRHAVTLGVAPAAGQGKFENLNTLLRAHPPAGYDWLLVLDDDVALPHGFLDRFIFLAERFEFRLAQPAHRHRSHAAWAVTRRRPGVVARQTSFVEIGPVTAFHRDVFETLLPFPPLRTGWGLDAHWSAVADQHGWPIGIVDATPVRHGLRRIASSYDRGDAIAEARAFLAERTYTPAREAQRTRSIYGSWR